MLMAHNVCPDNVFDWTTPQLKAQLFVADGEPETPDLGNVESNACEEEVAHSIQIEQVADSVNNQCYEDL
jgi:hypothetical protein